jgi:hypothetical protein
MCGDHNRFCHQAAVRTYATIDKADDTCCQLMQLVFRMLLWPRPAQT